MYFNKMKLRLFVCSILAGRDYLFHTISEYFLEAIAETREYRIGQLNRLISTMYPELSAIERKFVVASFQDILQNSFDFYRVTTFE